MSEFIVNMSEDWVNKQGEKLAEIVRCRDCRYYIDSLIFCNPFCSLMNDRDTEPDGFCAWGEREVDR